ncbi:MAG TPA: hypothetical protein VIV84_09850 [Burkholderiaceae bacterium]
MKVLLASTLISLAPGMLLAQERDPAEPKVQHVVIEDDAVRIEELRVRGLSVSLVVKPKNAAEYEVVPTPGGRDPSFGRGGSQGAAGKRVWNVLKF